jgi:hypothetical protein
MSRDWDDVPRRPRRYDDIDLRRPAEQLSGAVTGAGIFTIVMGALSILCSLSTGFCGTMILLVGEADRQQGGMLPAAFGATGSVIVGLALLYLIVGVCYLTAGIVTLQRRNWGRVFCLIMGGVSVLLGITQGVFTVLGFMGMDPFMADGDEGGQIFGAAVNLVLGLIYLSHAVVVFGTLLSSYNIAEFE